MGATSDARTTADEPQYLLSATSLSEDLDLDIAEELADERWRRYHAPALPEQTAARPDDRRVSPHDPLLPLLLALPVALGGWVGAKLALAAMAGALAALLVWTAVRRLGVRTSTAALTVLCFALSPPLSVYATQVYPELPAALVVGVAVAALTGPDRRRGTVVAGLAIAALPWLSIKYAPAAAALALVAVLRQLDARASGIRPLLRQVPRNALALVVGLALVGVAYAAVHLEVYGGLTPYAAGDHFTGGELTVAGTSPSWSGRSRRLVGLLVDRDFGLIVWSPAWVLGVVALAHLLRRRPPWWPVVVLPLGAGWLTATYAALTMHGFWWPGRQVVVVLPLVVLAVAWSAERVRLRAGLVTGLVLGASTHAWLVAGDSTWVLDPWSTGAPVVRLLRPLLPDLRTPATGDEIRSWAWTAVLLAVAVVGWRLGGGNRDEDAGAGKGADADGPLVDAHRDRAVG